MGLPYRVVISDKTLAEGVAEVVERASGEVTKMPLDRLSEIL